MSQEWIWVVMTVAALVTYGWRFLGVALSGRITPSGALLDWVGCVAYALLAGLVARMLLFPAGALGEAPLSARLAGLAIGLAAFLLSRRNLILGVTCGVVGVIAVRIAA